MFKVISRLIEKAATFETHSQTKILEKLAPFLEVCDISKVVSPSGAEKISPMSPKRSESPVVDLEHGRGKRLKFPSIKVRRNLNEELEIALEETVENVEAIEVNDDNDEDSWVDEETEWKPKPKQKRAKKERPQYQNTIDLLWGRFRVSNTLIALTINTICEDLGITDPTKYLSVTRVTNLLKKYDEKLLSSHTENHCGLVDLGKKYALKKYVQFALDTD